MYTLNFMTEKDYYSEKWERLPALRIAMFIKTPKYLYFELLKDGKFVCYGVRNSLNSMEFEGELPDAVKKLIAKVQKVENMVTVEKFRTRDNINEVAIAVDCANCFAKFTEIAKQFPEFVDYIYEWWNGKCFASETKKIVEEYILDTEEDIAKMQQAGVSQYVLRSMIDELIEFGDFAKEMGVI